MCQRTVNIQILSNCDFGYIKSIVPQVLSFAFNMPQRTPAICPVVIDEHVIYTDTDVVSILCDCSY